MDEVRRLSQLGGSDINEAKKTLANLATAMCRGAEAAADAADSAAKIFEQGAMAGGIASVAISAEGDSVANILKALGFVASNNEAKRKITEGAVRIDGVVVSDAMARILPGDTSIAVQLGAKKHGQIAAK